MPADSEPSRHDKESPTLKPTLKERCQEHTSTRRQFLVTLSCGFGSSTEARSADASSRASSMGAGSTCCVMGSLARSGRTRRDPDGRWPPRNCFTTEGSAGGAAVCELVAQAGAVCNSNTRICNDLTASQLGTTILILKRLQLNESPSEFLKFLTSTL